MSIPYITPFPLTDTRCAFLKRLVEDVARIVSTDSVDGWTYGTLLALELNKRSNAGADLAELLTNGLSPLEFTFLKRIRILRLATLRTPKEHCTRTFTYRGTDTDLKERVMI